MARAVHLGLRADDLVEELALAVFGARLDVGLRYRDGLAERPTVSRGEHDQAGARGGLKHGRPFLSRKGVFRCHGMLRFIGQGGDNRTMRSSPLRGLPRPSRLDVATHRSPCGVRMTV